MTANPKSKRRGFTLVELLVVIAIIGVLVALLLPAIQYAREAARRLNCSNNLGQLIVAVNHYEMTHSVYPAGTLDPKGPIINARLGYHHNWLVQCLPYLEQRNVWDAVDKSKSIYHASNAPVCGYTGNGAKMWWCPSQIFPGGQLSHYAACHSDTEKPIDAGDNGVFFLNSRVRYEDVSDGSSHTIFLGEKIADAWDMEWCSGTRGTIRNTGSVINLFTIANGGLGRPSAPTPYNGLPDANSSLMPGAASPSADPLEVPGLEPTKKPDEAEKTIRGVEEYVAGARATAQGQKVPAATLGSPLYVGGFSSVHPTGAQFAFGDGSVRFIGQMIAPAVLQQLGNRHDGKLPVTDF